MLQPQSHLHVTWRGWHVQLAHLPEAPRAGTGRRTPNRAQWPSQVMQALTCLTGAEEALQDVTVREQDPQCHLERSK